MDRRALFLVAAGVGLAFLISISFLFPVDAGKSGFEVRVTIYLRSGGTTAEIRYSYYPMNWDNFIRAFQGDKSFRAELKREMRAEVFEMFSATSKDVVDEDFLLEKSYKRLTLRLVLNIRELSSLSVSDSTCELTLRDPLKETGGYVNVVNVVDYGANVLEVRGESPWAKFSQTGKTFYRTNVKYDSAPSLWVIEFTCGLTGGRQTQPPATPAQTPPETPPETTPPTLSPTTPPPPMSSQGPIQPILLAEIQARVERAWVTWSPADERFALVLRNGSLSWAEIYDRSYRRVWESEKANWTTFGWSWDGRFFVLSTEKCRIERREGFQAVTGGGDVVYIPWPSQQVVGCEQRLTVYRENYDKAWGMKSGEIVWLGWSPDGKLALLLDRGGEGYDLEVYNSDYRKVWTLSTESRGYRSYIRWSPEGKLATLLTDRVEVYTKNLSKLFETSSASNMVWCPDGRLVSWDLREEQTRQGDRYVWVVEVYGPNGGLLGSISTQGLEAVACSADGRLALAVSEEAGQVVRIYDVDYEEIRSIPADGVISVGWSPRDYLYLRFEEGGLQWIEVYDRDYNMIWTSPKAPWVNVGWSPDDRFGLVICDNETGCVASIHQFSTPSVRVTASSSLTGVDLNIFLNLTPPLAFEHEASLILLEDGQTLASQPFNISSTANLTLWQELGPGNHSLTLKVRIGRGEVLSEPLQVSIPRVLLKSIYFQGGQLQVTISLLGSLDQPQSLTIRAMEGGREVASRDVKIAGEETVIMTLDLPIGTHNLTIEATSGGRVLDSGVITVRIQRSALPFVIAAAAAAAVGLIALRLRRTRAGASKVSTKGEE